MAPTVWPTCPPVSLAAPEPSAPDYHLLSLRSLPISFTQQCLSLALSFLFAVTYSLYVCFSGSPLVFWTAHVQRGSLEAKPIMLIRYTVCRKGHSTLPARHLNGHCNMGLCTHYHTKRMVQTGIDESKTTVTTIIVIEHWLTTWIYQLEGLMSLFLPGFESALVLYRYNWL